MTRPQKYREPKSDNTCNRNSVLLGRYGVFEATGVVLRRGRAYRVGMNANSNDVVSASEIASWEWCPEAWRLEARGEEPENEEELARGDAFHAHTTATEIASRRVAVLGRWLLIFGLVVAVLGFVLFCVGD